MPGPPPKPKGTPDDLAEVERALSVLKGRHPEHERVSREEAERKAKRRAELDKAAGVARSAALRTRLKASAVGAVLLLALVVLGLAFRREVVRRGRLEQSGDPYRAMGFVVVETTSRSSAGKLEATTDPGCFVATTTDTAPLEVARGATTIKGPAPVLFCTCQNEKLTITSEVSEGGGLTLLRVDAPMIGGSRAFAFAPFKPGATGRFDEGCNDTALDAWIDAKRFPAPAVDEQWLGADPRRAPLAANGKMAAMIEPSAPFAVVEAPKEGCLLATSSAADDKLSLRAKGGATPLAPTTGSIAWCASVATTMIVQRDGTGRVAVLTLPAQAIGGVLGLRELANSAGVPLAFVGLPQADHAWDAKALLLATSVPEALVKTASAPEIAKDADARVVALSFGTPNALSTESPADTYSYCEPPIVESTRESLCIFSGEPTLRPTSGEAVGAVARAPLPFWLFGLQGANDPVALKAAAALATLARRLKHDHFEPTTIEAMTELPNGVEILGRTNEDAVVAVGVMPAEPFVLPYGDGTPWSLDGDPRVVAIRPLQKITVTTTLKDRDLRKLPPKEKRRSVVFRRQVTAK